MHVERDRHIRGCFFRFFFAPPECRTGLNDPDLLFDLCLGFTIATRLCPFQPERPNRLVPDEAKRRNEKC